MVWMVCVVEQEQVAEKCHAFQRVIEAEIVPSIEGMVRHQPSLPPTLTDCRTTPTVLHFRHGSATRSADVARRWLMCHQMARFNASMDQILKDGEEFLEDMELAEANAQSAYRDYREQVRRHQEGDRSGQREEWLRC